MAIVSMKALLESGVHFGHRTHKWHPKMKPFIFTERNSIHIIDLQKTVKALQIAYDLVRDTVAEGGTVLFVGTKRQAQETIQDEALRCDMPYVTARWLGGMLTNWRTIRQRVNELERLERMRDSGEFERITKKEALNLTRKIDRLEMLLGGIRYMVGLPELLFVVDVRREDTSIHEANLLEIPVVAMVDTNCDPRNVDYVIPSNDDAIRAIKLLVGKIADAVVEGKAIRKDMEEEELVPVEAALEDVEELELSDEELLGEATLAKISSAMGAPEGEEVPEEGPAEAEAESAVEEQETVEVSAEEGTEAEETEEVEELEEAEAPVEEAVEALEGETEAEETEIAEQPEEAEAPIEEAVEALEGETEAEETEIAEEPEEAEAPVEEQIEALEDETEAEEAEEIVEPEEPQEPEEPATDEDGTVDKDAPVDEETTDEEEKE